MKRNALNEQKFPSQNLEKIFNSLETNCWHFGKKRFLLYYLFNLIPFSNFSLKAKNMILFP